MNNLQDVSTLLFIINLITMLMVVITIGIAPSITRKSLLFGVRIPEAAAQNKEVIKLKKGYICKMIIGGAIAIALLVVQYIIWPEASLLAILYLPIMVILFQFITYVSTWKKATILKKNNGWVVPLTVTVDTSSAVQRENFWGFPKAWYIPCVLTVLALIVISVAKYPALPAEMPTHWGFDMQPDVWSEKSFWTVLGMPLMALGLVVVMILSNIMVYRMKLQVSAEQPELSYAQHRIYRRMMSNSIGVCTLAITVFVALLQLMLLQVFVPSQGIMIAATLIMLVGSCVPFTYVYLKAGQSGCKLNPPVFDKKDGVISTSTKGQEKVKINSNGDDKYWKLGMFYYNDNDPAMLVEDRFGINSSFNYARLSSKIVTAILIILVVVVYIGATIMFIKN